MTAAEATKVGKRWEFWKKGTTQYKNLESVVSVKSLESLLPKSKGTTLSTKGSDYVLVLDERGLGFHTEAEQHAQRRFQGEHPARRGDLQRRQWREGHDEVFPVGRGRRGACAAGRLDHRGIRRHRLIVVTRVIVVTG